MKSLKSRQNHTKETIYWTTGQNILASVDIKTNSPFYGMILRTKSCVFTEMFLAVFALDPPSWPARLMFCLIWSAQNDGFIGEYCGEYFLWRQHGNDVTFSFGYYYTVTFYYLLNEDCLKAWSFKYQNFLTYVIIKLFPSIYIVI